MSIIHQILHQHHQAPLFQDSEYAWYEPDRILLPEYALALMAKDLECYEQQIHSPEKVMVVADHFAPPSTIERANILRTVQDLCQEHQLDLRLFDGICHQLLIEDPRTQPGTLIVGSDSHTVTAGALGALAMGFGSTDIYQALVYNRIALKIPRVLKIRLEGILPKGVMGKDIMLKVFSMLGHDQIDYAALLFEDATANGLSMSERFCVCNMVVEGGGKAALFSPDAITEAYTGNTNPSWLSSLSTVNIQQEWILDVSSMEPMVALPSDPFNVIPLSELQTTRLDQVYLGSCNAGRLEDFAVAAEILKKNKVAPGLKAIATPSSRKIYLEAMKAGYLETLIEAGVIVNSPGCGPCGAIDKGLLADGENCAATINRNYQGRMGSPDAKIYLINSAIAAQAMITGTLGQASQTSEQPSAPKLFVFHPKQTAPSNLIPPASSVHANEVCISGNAHILGDDVNTDLLHPSCFYSLDPARQAAGVLGHSQTTLPHQTIMVAGKHFGVGSSRESTIRGLKAAGVVAIVAESISRIFMRNAFNAGLVVLESTEPLPELKNGVELQVRIHDQYAVLDIDSEAISLVPPDPYLMQILRAGGLLRYLGLGKSASSKA